MTGTTTDWLDGQVDRLIAGQRASVDTAKLVATFAAAVAATLVGSALEVGTPSRTDHRAVWFLAFAIALSVLVVLLDRLAVADHGVVLERAVLLAWDDGRVVRELRVANLKAANANEKVVRDVRVALAVQLLVTVTTGALAAASLLNAS